MHRSGLALAGAQTTIEAWKRDEVPPVENDGILTAEDVSTLDLQGTWLVTLSACDTGSGEARAGEGVMGLRRGFIQAGAQTVTIGLWFMATPQARDRVHSETSLIRFPASISMTRGRQPRLPDLHLLIAMGTSAARAGHVA